MTKEEKAQKLIDLKRQIKDLKLQVGYLAKMLCLDCQTCKKRKQPLEMDEFLAALLTEIDETNRH